ncbi:hypothetical protein SUGI_0109660 [Cryptomeria japonica]|uniref:trihelix transcription factor ASR3 isoform X2 n=1 Tax=Cryptomeria japonica TaxID=3369 RepID=UPI002408CF3B|nr:trihelix transcription factor ASR3 isoform X2 [Cryptomeria japonica]GLJ09431.1 hypothetical protein SUGI_0109660 [Cryptomeria japonica]
MAQGEMRREDEDKLGDPSDRTPPRFPRWTRHEILVLIEGKRVEECKGRRSRATDSCPESKWAAISSYCKQHGVSREPVQCRKRWTTLWRDYKRIRDWDSQHPDRVFWSLRSDAKREFKLPAFFDRELYDVLERSIVSSRHVFTRPPSSPPLPLSEAKPAAGGGVGVVGLESGGRSAVEEEFEQPCARGVEEGEEEEEEEIAGSPEKRGPDSPLATPSGLKSDKLPTSNGEKVSTSSGAGQKRMHVSSEVDEDRDLKQQLLSILERNGQLLSAQVEAHNLNCQLDRDQRNEHAESLVGVLGKLADALGRIADKLQ